MFRKYQYYIGNTALLISTSTILANIVKNGKLYLNYKQNLTTTLNNMVTENKTIHPMKKCCSATSHTPNNILPARDIIAN